MTTLENDIRRVFAQVWAMEKGAEMPKLPPDAVLLETGLDSLGFAIFVSSLEEDLGYDPFTLSQDAYYPQTCADFMGFYDRHRSVPCLRWPDGSRPE